MAGVLLSVTMVVVVARKLEWIVLARQISLVNINWVVLTIACNIGGLLARACRWRWIAGGGEYRLFHFWKATCAGAFANQVLPARAGEVVKIAIVHKSASVPLGAAAFSAIYDRLADVLVLVISGFAVVMLQSNSFVGRVAVEGALLIVLALVIAGAAFGRYGHRLPAWSAAVARALPGGLARRLNEIYGETLHSANELFQLRRLLGLLGITTVVFVFDYGAILGALNAFSWQLPGIAPVTVWVFLALATALPSAPGYVGVYQVACILALGLFGIDESSAVAFALMFQVATIGTAAALTAVFYLRQWRAGKANA